MNPSCGWISAVDSIQKFAVVKILVRRKKTTGCSRFDPLFGSNNNPLFGPLSITNNAQQCWFSNKEASFFFPPWLRGGVRVESRMKFLFDCSGYVHDGTEDLLYNTRCENLFRFHCLRYVHACCNARDCLVCPILVVFVVR